LPGIYLGLLSSGCGKTNKLNLNYPFPKHPQPYSILCLSMTMYCHHKFQAIVIGSKTSNESISFNLDGNKIDCEKEVKLLGVTIDYQLKFNTHISNIYNLHK
jgi:flagellar basal body rod protein FlgB